MLIATSIDSHTIMDSEKAIAPRMKNVSLGPEDDIGPKIMADTPPSDTPYAPSILEESQQIHSVFTSRQRGYIVTLAAVIVAISVLSQFIFFPVISLVAESLETSVSKINLTVTVFTAMEAIAPAFVSCGRSILLGKMDAKSERCC